MADDETRDDLTEGEERVEEDTDVSGEVAHRVGEFRDLRDRLERVEDGQNRILEAVERVARALATRTVETDGDEPEDTGGDAGEAYTDPRERDYSL